MIGNIQMTLFILRQIVRPMIHNSHVRIPFDVIYFRIIGHQSVYKIEYEILHLRITQVKHHLRPSTPQYRFAQGSFQNPFRMFLVKFTSGIGHFRFNPYTELHLILAGIVHQFTDTTGQLPGIHLPVAQ